MTAPPAFLVIAAVALAQTWVAETSTTTVSLRGVSAVSAKVVWASGGGGVWLRTVNGGATWQSGKVPGTEALDFRGVRAFSETTAYLMSSGPGDKSRIYKTTDGGSHWNLLLTNPDAKGFFDAIAFWTPARGLVVGDPVDGHSVVLTTADGGQHWSRQPTPAALAEEGAFAASNSCLVVRGSREAWFATGGRGGSRVLHSLDGGISWTAATTPVRNDLASAGIFSLAFSDGRHGIAVGGDYAHDQESRGNFAFTGDGGATWTGGQGPHGYRSVVVYLADRKAWLAAGTSGSDISVDGGRSWRQFDSGSLNAISAISSRAVWAVGPKGKIFKFDSGSAMIR
jgi:photosystem II stability/assembly factor-like uncharacterized protein